MKTQVVVIHGGDSFEKYEDYLEYLRTRDVSLERLLSKDWKAHLQESLGDNFLVIAPRMPNAMNARYLEWKIWFERIVRLLDEKVIFIGHSLGGIFLAKYLSENNYPKKIIATLLVAVPYNTSKKHPLTDFILSDDATPFKNFEWQGGTILIYHSKDDPVVPYSNCEDYKAALPKAELRIFEDRKHFNGPEFPELVEDIKRNVY